VNHALRRISLTCLIMFVALLVNLNYWQGFKTNFLAGSFGNSRTTAAEQDFQRGPITTADGKVIADSHAVPGAYQRQYFDGPVYAPVTGYDTLFSQTGIEAAENSYLAGDNSQLAVRNLLQLFNNKPPQGATVQLTINSQVQQAAYQALQAAPHPPGDAGDGAVAIDPATGAILALASYPSFNPNKLTSLSSSTLEANDNKLLDAPNKPLLSRATQVTFHPGSSFKVITASTAFTAGPYNPQTNFPAPTVLSLPDTSTQLHNDGDTACADGDPPLIEAFALSCNTAYGGLGLKLGSRALVTQADKFGFNSSLDIPFPVAQSTFPHVSDAYTAYSAIGQFDDAETPLQEAMVAAAIANHGLLMKPYLVKQVTGPQVSIQATAPAVLHRAVSPSVASEVASMMRAVVTEPYGTAFSVPGIQSLDVAGKTGTAENGINNSNTDDAVFTCFAPASNPQIAVGVIIGGGGFGAAAAAPVAVAMINAYRKVLGSQWNQ
jgi:peptidoglycan glycosyltransferase